MQRATVDLPEPLSPISATVSPALDLEVHAVDRGERVAAALPAQREALDQPGAWSTGALMAAPPRSGWTTSSSAVYGSAGAVIDLLGGADLAHLAGAHHHDVVAGLGDDPEVVGDQAGRHGPLTGELDDQVEDVGLDRHVEPGGRLVEDEQGRPAGQRQRDLHPLRRSAGELVRILMQATAGFRHLDAGEHLLRERARLLLGDSRGAAGRRRPAASPP